MSSEKDWIELMYVLQEMNFINMSYDISNDRMCTKLTSRGIKSKYQNNNMYIVHIQFFFYRFYRIFFYIKSSNLII